MILHEGIGNLGEDPAGKHNHQLESKEELCLGDYIRSFKRREGFKSKEEAMFKKHAKWMNTDETERRCTEKRQRCINAREEALVCSASEGVMKTLRRMCEKKMASN
jgi:hypothetical protein